MSDPIDQALSEEASEVRSDPFDGFGNRLPGAPANEQFKIGGPSDYPVSSYEPMSHVPFGMDELIDQIPVGSNFGSLSMDVGLQRDMDNLYNSDAMRFFAGEDQQHLSGLDNMRGSDSMRGIAGLGGIHDGTLANEDMYLQPQNEVGVTGIGHAIQENNQLPRSLDAYPESTDE